MQWSTFLGKVLIIWVQRLIWTLLKLWINFRWGKFVARHPLAVIIVSFLVVVLCCVGNVKIHFEADANRMWIPEESPYLPHKEWIEKNFQVQSFFAYFWYIQFWVTYGSIRYAYIVHQSLDRRDKLTWFTLTSMFSYDSRVTANVFRLWYFGRGAMSWRQTTSERCSSCTRRSTSYRATTKHSETSVISKHCAGFLVQLSMVLSLNFTKFVGCP